MFANRGKKVEDTYLLIGSNITGPKCTIVLFFRENSCSVNLPSYNYPCPLHQSLHISEESNSSFDQEGGELTL